MDTWEASHASELKLADMESSSHFFGFAGQALMSGLFDFVFVSADLRVGEEARDARSAVIGRILEHTIDRKQADAELQELLEQTSKAQSKIHSSHFKEVLKELSADLTGAVVELARGRDIRVSTITPDLQPQPVQFQVSVGDGRMETRADRQGHGFQRALLIAALRLLAERGAAALNASVICIAIEEPELYQHPLQARSFAVVLRKLAESDRGIQVAYATHSPYFIEARSFHQIRRVTQESMHGGVGAVRVVGSSLDRVVDRLDGVIPEDRIRKQLDSVCVGQLGEGFFAKSVLLVEGTTERAVIQGAATRDSTTLLMDGVFVGEAGGKTGLLLPYVILDELGIPAYVCADNDSHLVDLLEEAQAEGPPERARKLLGSLRDSIAWNRRILAFFGLDETDWPEGRVARNLTFVDGGLEQALHRDWPAWVESRENLIECGVGFSGKNGATYQEAAVRAEGAVPSIVLDLLKSVKQLQLAA